MVGIRVLQSQHKCVALGILVSESCHERTAGRIRTYDQPLSQNGALSAELQRYAIWNLD